MNQKVSKKKCKKLPSKTIIAILVFIGLLSFGMTRFLFSCSHDFGLEEKIDSFYLNVSKSAEMHMQVMAPFMIGSKEREGTITTLYCDNFSGIFIDNEGMLNIGLTDNIVMPLSLSGQVRHVLQAFSLNQLKNAKEKVVTVMIDFNISKVGIDEQRNIIFVETVCKDVPAKVTKMLSEKSLYRKGMLHFVVDSSVEVAKTLNSAPSGGAIGDGTLGFSARCNFTGDLGVVTNEHVAPVGTEQSYLGKVLGVSARGQFGGTVDAAFIPFHNQNAWSPSAFARLDAAAVLYSNIRLGNEYQIIQGKPVRRLGRTTGDTTGVIASRYVTINVVGTVFTNQFTFTNFSELGDSGGPVYFNDAATGSLFLIGLNFTTNWTVGFGSRVTEIASALNITPITNDSFNFTHLPNDSIIFNGLNVSIKGAFAIPENINGIAVTQLGAFALQNFAGYSIRIPSTVKTIGNNAFLNATGLRILRMHFVTPPRINRTIFSGVNRSLITLEIPKNHISIYQNLGWTGFVFREVGIIIRNNLAMGLVIPSDFNGHLMIPIGVRAIAPNAFLSQQAVTSVSIPSSVTSVGRNAFLGTGLFGNGSYSLNRPIYADNWLVGISGSPCSESYTVRAGTVGIADYVFASRSIRTIIMPESLRYIGMASFAASRINTFVMSKATPPIVGDRAFVNVTATMIVPTDLLQEYRNIVLNWQSFITVTNAMSNTRLTNFSAHNPPLRIYILHGITTIYAYAFLELQPYASRTVILPTTVAYIGHHAFPTHTNVTWHGRFSFRDNIYIVHRGDELEVQIPSIAAGRKITIINSNAFRYSPRVESVTLPSSITRVNTNAFTHAMNLQRIVMQGSVPPTFTASINSVFGGLDRSQIELVVPLGSEQAYINAGWVGFKGCEL